MAFIEFTLRRVTWLGVEWVNKAKDLLYSENPSGNKFKPAFSARQFEQRTHHRFPRLHLNWNILPLLNKDYESELLFGEISVEYGFVFLCCGLLQPSGALSVLG